jgi:serine/threonine protein kinase
VESSSSGIDQYLRLLPDSLQSFDHLPTYDHQTNNNMPTRNFIYHLPFGSKPATVQLRDAFDVVKRFDSREGKVELVESKRSPGKLRIIKSVKHRDKQCLPREARALTYRPLVNGARHPNIIHLFQCELNPSGWALMCFEYCSGGDLWEQVHGRKGRTVTPLFALHIAISISEAFAFLHHGLVYDQGNNGYIKVSHGEPVVHQDCKEDNVFLRWPGKTGSGLPDVVLADTGLSNLESQTHPGWGCEPYMSPECLRGTVSHPTHKTDMYSFGVMMEHILNLCTTRLWPMFKDPQTLMIDEQYKGLGFTNVLKSCVQVRASDRGDFSGFTGRGMLFDVLKFRGKRSEMLRNGEKIDKSYWAANR